MNFRAGKERCLHCTHFLRWNVVYQNKWRFKTSISCRSVLIHMYLHSNWLYNQSEQTAVWPSLWQLTLKADVLRKKWQVNMKRYSDLGSEENKRWDTEKKGIWGGGTGEEGASRYWVCLWCWAYTVIPQSLKENERTSVLFWPTFSEQQLQSTRETQAQKLDKKWLFYNI